MFYTERERDTFCPHSVSNCSEIGTWSYCRRRARVSRAKYLLLTGTSCMSVALLRHPHCHHRCYTLEEEEEEKSSNNWPMIFLVDKGENFYCVFFYYSICWTSVTIDRENFLFFFLTLSSIIFNLASFHFFFF